MKKIMKHVLNKNYKKGFIYFIIIAFIFAIISVGTGIGVFGNRIEKVSKTLEKEESNQEENDKEKSNSKNENGDKEKDVEEILNLSTGEEILIVIFIVIGALLIIYYWIFIIGCTIKIADKFGADIPLFGVLALLTNVFAIIILLIYRHFSTVCPKCGRIQSRDSLYCKDCGCIIVTICDQCRNINTYNSSYCNKCGTKLDK